MEFKLKNGVYIPKAPEVKDELAREPAWCARYARIVSSLLLIGKEDDKRELWIPRDGWNFKYFNRSVWSPEDGQLDYRNLRRGQILGIRIPYSEHNKRRDKRNNLISYSHLATVLGHFFDGESVRPWIAHNIYGVGEPESLFKFLMRTGSAVLEVFNPRDESVLRR